MTFSVAAEGYDRFIGRYSRILAPGFLESSGAGSGPVLDVGCGPGSLTEVLVARFGASQVAAIDPTGPFVEACRLRAPGADVRVVTAESLPFDDGFFGGALSQLVVSFVSDAPRAAA
jgi:trans-aconitate methyltransferase